MWPISLVRLSLLIQEVSSTSGLLLGFSMLYLMKLISAIFIWVEFRVWDMGDVVFSLLLLVGRGWVHRVFGTRLWNIGRSNLCLRVFGSRRYKSVGTTIWGMSYMLSSVVVRVLGNMRWRSIVHTRVLVHRTTWEGSICCVYFSGGYWDDISYGGRQKFIRNGYFLSLGKISSIKCWYRIHRHCCFRNLVNIAIIVLEIWLILRWHVFRKSNRLTVGTTKLFHCDIHIFHLR